MSPRKLPVEPNPDSIEPSRRPPSYSPQERKVQIAAARARVTLDKLTGDITPDWIIALSKEVPDRG